MTTQNNPIVETYKGINIVSSQLDGRTFFSVENGTCNYSLISDVRYIIDVATSAATISAKGMDEKYKAAHILEEVKSGLCRK